MIQNLELYLEMGNLNYWLVMAVLTGLGSFFLYDGYILIKGNKKFLSAPYLVGGTTLLAVVVLMLYASVGVVTVSSESLDQFEAFIAAMPAYAHGCASALFVVIMIYAGFVVSRKGISNLTAALWIFLICLCMFSTIINIVTMTIKLAETG